MKYTFVILILNICWNEICVDAKPCDPTPEWAQQYTVKGVLTHSNGKIEESFEAWYDGINGNSRVDYREGTVSQYHLSYVGEFGRFYRIVPVINKRKCQKVDVRQVVGENETKEFVRVSAQSVLPDLDLFKYNGTETILGLKCHRFFMREQLFDDSFYYTTMWVQYKISKKKYQNAIKYIPVRYEKLNIDKNEELLSWYKIDYESYEPSFKGFSLKKVFKVNDRACIVAQIFRESLYNRMAYFISTSGNVERNIEIKNDTTSDKETDDEADETDETDEPNEYDARTLARLPQHLDWRLLGAVSPVRDQTNVCGSCWAFSTVGAIEGALFVHSGMKELVRLSEQALIDCVWKNESEGCVGGFDYEAFEWIKNNGGIPTDESYGKYKAIEGICHANDSNIVLKAPITGWAAVAPGDPIAMKLALLQNGPVAVTIHATEKFLNYVGGEPGKVFFDPKCKKGALHLNHAILVVGYGTNEDDEEFWILRNSHGIEWGDEGYMSIAARDNHCGVLTQPLYPVLDVDLYA